jgi:hypothetical protein
MTKWITGGVAALTLAIVNASAQAAGLWLYEQGTPDVGTASAGMTSRAQDAATAFANPAGMTRLEGSQFMLGIQPIYADVKSDVDVATFGGGNGGNAGGFVPSGGLFYVHSVSDDLKLGFSAGSYLGLGVTFDNDWAGRYYSQRVDFTTLFANGSVGYRINDWLSVGGGVSVVHGSLGYKAALNNVLDGRADGRVRFKDDDTDVGANVGVLIEPRKGTRFALTYLSKVDFDFKDDNLIRGAGPLLNVALQVSGLGGGTTKLKWTLPQRMHARLLRRQERPFQVNADRAGDRADRLFRSVERGPHFLRAVGNQRRKQRRRSETAMRRGNGADPLHRRLVVEQHAAAAVDLQVDKARREPGAFGQIEAQNCVGQVAAIDQRDNVFILDNDRSAVTHGAAIENAVGHDRETRLRRHRVRVTFCRLRGRSMSMPRMAASPMVST